MPAPVLIYDGRCPFCVAMVHRLRRLDQRGRVRCVSSETPGVLDACGVTVARAQARVWLRHPSGVLVGGAGAVLCALDAVCGWRWGSRLYSWAPARWLVDHGYAWVAVNRMRLGFGGSFGGTDCGDDCRVVA